MSKLNLFTASVDLIFSTDNQFVFLELNPLGIFNGFGEDCNYLIETKISNYLIEKSKISNE